MDILRTPDEMRAWRRRQQGTVGLVPTMGYLHEGHLSLLEAARSENDHVVVSIFVNPAQFGPNEDFERYPRNEQRDLELIEGAGGGAVYMPDAATMYPTGFETYVKPGATADPLEGAARPGHFQGVLTVVLKLFNAVEPDRAYFGKKDAQQLRLIRRMVRDLDLGVSIVPCPIVREADGLAMSSRNVYLSPAERAAATIINLALSEASEAYAAGERDAELIRGMVRDRIAGEPLSNIEYVSVADNASLAELAGQFEGRALLSVAVRFGSTRLIDNVELGEQHPAG